MEFWSEAWCFNFFYSDFWIFKVWDVVETVRKVTFVLWKLFFFSRCIKFSILSSIMKHSFKAKSTLKCCRKWDCPNRTTQRMVTPAVLTRVGNQSIGTSIWPRCHQLPTNTSAGIRYYHAYKLGYVEIWWLCSQVVVKEKNNIKIIKDILWHLDKLLIISITDWLFWCLLYVTDF